MANEKQFGIKEVMSLAITDYVSKAPIAYIPYATETTVGTTSERLDLKGGQGNYSLTSWDHTKEMSLNINLPLVDLTLLGHLTGSGMTTGATTAHDDDLYITEGATPTITLKATPISGTLKLYVMNSDYDIGEEQLAGTPASTPNKYSITGKTVTLNGTTAPAGTKILAMYDYTTDANANLITVLADKFNEFVRVTGTGVWRNTVSGADEVVSFDFKKVKFKPNFTLTQSSTDATSLDLEADLYFVTSGLDKIYANIVKV